MTGGRNRNNRRVERRLQFTLNAVYNFECHEGKKGRKALIIPAGDAVPKLPTGGTEGRRSGNAELERV